MDASTFVTAPVGTLRRRYQTRYAQLVNERDSYWPIWQQITDYIAPQMGRYTINDTRQGRRRTTNIYDSTATDALDVLAAGLMAGMTSPARPWFRLETPDADLNKYAPVKAWLFAVTQLILTVFNRSNTYRGLHSTYEEIGAFGTGCSLILPDFQDVVRWHPQTMGRYAIAADERGEVKTLYREIPMTVEQVVREFGLKNVSLTTRTLYDNNNLNQLVPVLHVIEPRRERDPLLKTAKNMPYASVYFELSRNDRGDTLLRESGLKRFRAVVPRWRVTGGDVWGSGPGHKSLGDAKQLQHEQLRKATAIDYQTQPPLQVPTGLKHERSNQLPGGVTFYNPADVTSGAPIRSMFDVNLRLDYLLQDIQDVRGRINTAFYKDLFLMISGDSGPRMTATEVAERHEEKMLMLGPVLERLHNELLEPLIDITFEQVLQAGILPPPPPELHGIDLNVEFVSVLAQAQRAVATNSIDRFVGSLGMISQYKPEVLDKFDSDEWADVYSDSLGIDPNLIVANDKVAIIRQQRAEAQQKQQQQEAMAQAAQNAKNLAGASTEGKNALTDVMDAFSGYGS